MLDSPAPPDPPSTGTAPTPPAAAATSTPAPAVGPAGRPGTAAAGAAATPLDTAVTEVEAHVAGSGWDQPIALFALVDTAALLADQPQLADAVPGLAAAADRPGALTPVEQEHLDGADADLGAALAQVSWPPEVAGCVLVQEALVLPPDAEAAAGAAPAGTDAAAWAAAQPAAREMRLAVGVLRDGSVAATLRLRPLPDQPEEPLVTGAGLAPALAAALVATFDAD